MSEDEPSRYAETVDELGPEDSGRWVVVTEQSMYVLDLDERTVSRRPMSSMVHMPHDSGIQRLTRVEVWPKVGEAFFFWFDDPQHPDQVEHWRISTRIVTIGRLGNASPPDNSQGTGEVSPHTDPRIHVVTGVLYSCRDALLGCPLHSGTPAGACAICDLERVDTAKTILKAIDVWDRGRDFPNAVTTSGAAFEPAQLENTDKVVMVHSSARCWDDICSIHHRTDHHMRSWPQDFRTDVYRMERTCPHGIGHPDPDDYFIRNGQDNGLHACDGCCT